MAKIEYKHITPCPARHDDGTYCEREKGSPAAALVHRLGDRPGNRAELPVVPGAVGGGDGMTTKTRPFICLYTGPADECWNCGGWTKAEDGPFEGDHRFCSEDCFAEFQERYRESAARRDDWCPDCGYDRHEHAPDCAKAVPR